MINIKLTEDTQCTVIRRGEEEKVTYPKGTCFFDVIEYKVGVKEWQHLDEDMVSTFIPQKNTAVLS